MTPEEVRKMMLLRPEEAPYIPYSEIMALVNGGGQMLLPFDAGDAPVTFSSRWALAAVLREMLEEALNDR